MTSSRFARIFGTNVEELAELAKISWRTDARVFSLRDVDALGFIGALRPSAGAGKLAVLARVPAGASADVGGGGSVEASATVETRRSEARVDHFAQAAPEAVGTIAAKIIDGQPQRKADTVVETGTVVARVVERTVLSRPTWYSNIMLSSTSYLWQD